MKQLASSFRRVWAIAMGLSLAALAQAQQWAPTASDSARFVLSETYHALPAQHTKHAETLGPLIDGHNHWVLQAIDHIQQRFPDGGGYFAGLNADPPESPIGYDLNLWNNELLDAPRTTSYCSGSSYTAFIEALNLMYADSALELPAERAELLRMQEPDGGRRNDGVKMWGNWNNNGFGNYDALIAYSGMGKQIPPENARPGDFMNISWNHGGGHSVVFLGWYKNSDDEKFLAYWSSQRSTNGLGDDYAPLNKIREVLVVRMMYPGRIRTFQPQQPAKKGQGTPLHW